MFHCAFLLLWRLKDDQWLALLSIQGFPGALWQPKMALDRWCTQMAGCSLVQHLKTMGECYYFAPSNFFLLPSISALDTSEKWPFLSAATWGNLFFKKTFLVVVVCRKALNMKFYWHGAAAEQTRCQPWPKKWCAGKEASLGWRLDWNVKKEKKVRQVMLVWQCGQPSNRWCLHCGKQDEAFKCRGEPWECLWKREDFLLASMPVEQVLVLFWVQLAWQKRLSSLSFEWTWVCADECMSLGTEWLH